MPTHRNSLLVGKITMTSLFACSHRALLAILTAAPLLASAQTAGHPLLEQYRAAARQENVGFKDFSATAGKTLYQTKHGELACASCHTDSPRGAGRHVKTNKDIAPLSPAVNAKRFTDAANAEKWFKRNCNDVLGRACTAQEKGDFLSYVLTAS